MGKPREEFLLGRPGVDKQVSVLQSRANCPMARDRGVQAEGWEPKVMLSLSGPLRLLTARWIWAWLEEFLQALPLAKPASQVQALATSLWLNKDPLHLRPPLQDCLRACQEQIEALLESSLRQAQQNVDPKATEEEGEAEGETDLACTPTDVRDVDI